MLCKEENTDQSYFIYLLCFLVCEKLKVMHK